MQLSTMTGVRMYTCMRGWVARILTAMDAVVSAIINE